MAMDYSGLFVNPATIRQQRVGDIVKQQQRLAGLGGSMSGLLGQVAGMGGVTGSMLAEGIAQASGMTTAEERQAQKAQDIFKTLDPNDPETYFKAAKALGDAGLTKASLSIIDRGTQLKADQQQMQFALNQEARSAAEETRRQQLFPTQVEQAQATLQSTRAGTEATQSQTRRAEELQPWQLQQIQSGIKSTDTATRIRLAQEGRALIEFDTLFPLKVQTAEQDLRLSGEAGARAEELFPLTVQETQQRIQLQAEEGERARTMFPIKIVNESLRSQATQTQIEQARQNMTIAAQQASQAAELHPYKVESAQLGLDQLNSQLQKLGLEIDIASYDLSQKGKPTPAQYAESLKVFTQESVDTYYNTPPSERTTGMLTPLEAPSRKAASTFGKQLVDQGMQPGSEEFIDHMRQFNEATIKGKTQQTIRQMSDPMKQAEFVEKAIISDDLFKMAQKSDDAARKARSVLGEAKRKGGEALSILQRSLSTVYESNSRAASEIDRLIRDNKSIARSFEDFTNKLVSGQVSAETFKNYETLLASAERNIREQKTEVVDRKMGVYGSYLTDEVKADINATYGNVDPLGLNNL